jgi:hypothetical protein
MMRCCCGCGMQVDLHIGLDTSRGPMRFTCQQALDEELIALGTGDTATVGARMAWLRDHGCERVARLVRGEIPFDGDERDGQD